MTLLLELSPADARAVTERAAAEGVSASQLITRLLAEAKVTAPPPPKPYRVMDFAGAARPQRTAAEIDAIIAEVEAGRDEWDERDLRQDATPRQMQP